MFLGLYTRKEVNKEKLKSYNNGYDDGTFLFDSLFNITNIKEERIYQLEKENKELKRKARVERHEEVRQIKAIAKRTKKYRVKKKCEARLLKIRLKR